MLQMLDMSDGNGADVELALGLETGWASLMEFGGGTALGCRADQVPSTGGTLLGWFASAITC